MPLDVLEIAAGTDALPLGQLKFCEQQPVLVQTTVESLLPLATQLEATLTANEFDRANRYHFSVDRQAFLARRGLLRLLLSDLLEQPADRIEIGIGSTGKPFLLNHSELHFNVSYSAGKLLIGFRQSKRIGVDVEVMRTLSERREMARQVFSKSDCATIEDARSCEQNKLFFRAWTRLESFVKATGAGLTDRSKIDFLSHTDSIEVSCGGVNWLTEDLELTRPFAAAVTLECPAG
ncbi:MAG: 4'-phosphopantetheinyl transferase superfamily protein [Fuerstiella sp.]